MSRCTDFLLPFGRSVRLAVLAGLAISCGTAGAFGQSGDVAQPEQAVRAPARRLMKVDPLSYFLPAAPDTTALPGPFQSRGSVTLYSRINLGTQITGNFGYGGDPDGSGTQPDIYVEDVPIPVARLAVSGATTQMISVCEVRVGIYTFVGATPVDVKVYWGSLTSTATAPDTSVDTPMNLIGTFTIPAAAANGTKIVILGDGVNPIPGMEAIPLNMEYLQGGGPVTFGTFAIGAQIMRPDDANIGGWRMTTGPDANGDFFWVYDSDLNGSTTPTGPETGPFAYGGTAPPPASFYVSIKGTPVAPVNPVACCVPGATSSVCFVADGAANCAKSDGTALTGQTTCVANACVPIACCNVTTGVCSVFLGTATCPGTQVLQSGQTSCATVTCPQPSAPANDECAAATPGSLFELNTVSNPTRTGQTMVGATESFGDNIAPPCTFADTDVWYVLTVNPGQESAQFKITATPTPSSGDHTLQPLALAVYDGAGGCPTGPGTELVCGDFANPKSVIFTGNGSSTSYLVRVGYFRPGTTLFSISASTVTTIACCNPSNGLCVLSNNVGDCVTQPGYTVPAPGGATTCGTNPCPRGACCNGAVCSITGPSGTAGCPQAGYQGDSTTCTPTNPCSGACCNNTTFACTLTNAAGCGAGSTFTFNGSVCTTAGICPAPPNDLCPGVALTLNTPVTGFVSSATGSDLTSCSGSTVDVWYSFTAPGTGNYSIKATPATATDVGVALAIFNAPCDPIADTDLDCLGQAAAGTATELLDTLTAGQQILIRVGAFAGDNGEFSILISQPGGLGACCGIGAQCLVVALATDCPAPAEYRGANTTCAAPATQCPPGACCFPLSGQCFVTLQAFCQGHQGTWNGADTTCGTTSCPTGLPVNDDCLSAATITSPTYVSNVGTEQASLEGLPAGACNSAAAQTVGANNSIWYQFTAPSNGILNIQVDDWTGYDLFMSVFTGTCAGLTEIGCFDEPEPLNVNATLTNGTTIFIMIAQWDVTVGGGWTTLTTSFSATGSCCVGTACSVGVTQAACTGTWNGANSTCTPDPCVPTGICCRGATCDTTVTQANCTTTGFLAGATFPAGPACTGSSFTGCCYGDYNKQTGVTVGDIFDFLNDWFAGSPFANTGGNGSAVPLAVQNIFDFLNAWFAGCV